MKLVQYALFSLLCALISAQVPEKCIVPAGGPIGQTTEGSIISASDTEVLSKSDGTAHFFGLEACTDLSTGRLVTVQFYLKNDGNETLFKGPLVGPSINKANFKCEKKKLERLNMTVNKIEIYSTTKGIEAMKFFVSPLSETFGKIPDIKEPGYNVTSIEFTKDRPLTTIRGRSSFSGIKYVAFQVLDKNCLKEIDKEGTPNKDG